MAICRFTLIALLLVLVACAGTPPGDPNNPGFSRVAVLSPGEVIVLAEEAFEEKGGSTAGEVVEGALEGAAAGVLLGLGHCVYFLYNPVCFGAAAALGMVGGAASASGPQAHLYVQHSPLSYHFSGLSGEEEIAMMEGASRAMAERDIHTELSTAIRDSLPASVKGTPEEADAQAVIHVERIRFVKHMGGAIHLRVLARLTYALGDQGIVQSEGGRPFTAESTPMPMSEMFGAGGESFSLALADCQERLANQISQVIRQHHRDA